MNSAARNQNWQIRAGDWSSHAYTPTEEADKKVGDELEGKIHPLLGFVLDDVPEGAWTNARWGELSSYEYRLLCPALRLATRLLESAPSSDAICSIVYGARRPSPENTHHQGILVSEFHRHRLPPWDVRKTAARVLRRLGKSIRFSLTDVEHPMIHDMRSNGRTAAVPTGFPFGVAVTDQPLHRGVSSIIMLDIKYLDVLTKLVDENSGKEFEICKLHFELAVTICHEVMHAIDFALSSDLLFFYIENGDDSEPPPFTEPFYQGQTVAELGYFWENQVFGGACIQSLPTSENPVYLCEWPSWLFRDKCQHPERAPPIRRALKWLISAYYIKNIQTHGFWCRLNVNHSEDLLALRIRKRVAIKCVSYRDDEDYDQTWDPYAPENLLGDFERVPFTDNDPSPGSKLANENSQERDARMTRERQSLTRALQGYLDRTDSQLRGSD